MKLALTLLAGCWPYIPGTWEDYAVPEGTQAAGHVDWVEPLGDYWADNTAYGSAYWGWLDPLDTEHTAWDLGYVTEGCVTEAPDTAWFDDGVREADDAASTLSGEPNIVLEWQPKASRYEADLSEEPTGTYQLEPFHIDGETYAGADTLVMPAPVEWNTSLLDGKEPQAVTEDQLATVKWPPRDDEALFAIIQLFVVEGSSAAAALQCGAPLSAGRLELDLDQLGSLKGSDYVILMLGVGRQTESLVDGAGTISRFLGTRHVEGAVTIR